MKTILSIIWILVLIPTFLSAQSSYEVVVSTDFDGEVSSGSIEALITEIRKGKPVRVGWQLDFNNDKQPDFDHWVDAEFITILGGHVFTQIETIFVQSPNEQIPQVEIFPSSDQWTAVIGTNGKLMNRFIMSQPPKIESVDGKPLDEKVVQQQLEQMKKVQTWKVATFWSVLK